MSDEIDLQLGRRVRRRRRLLGLTQGELAARCGIRFQQIQKYESAANKMSASMIARLAQALGVEAGYFFEGLTGVIQDPAGALGIHVKAAGGSSRAPPETARGRDRPRLSISRSRAPRPAILAPEGATPGLARH